MHLRLKGGFDFRQSDSSSMSSILMEGHCNAGFTGATCHLVVALEGMVVALGGGAALCANFCHFFSA